MTSTSAVAGSAKATFVAAYLAALLGQAVQRRELLGPQGRALGGDLATTLGPYSLRAEAAQRAVLPPATPVLVVGGIRPARPR